jgi:hypothetical protein
MDPKQDKAPGERSRGIIMVEQREVFQEAFQLVISDLAQGRKKTAVVKSLIRYGWSDEEAIQFVSYAEKALAEYKVSAEGQRLFARRYCRHMWYGFLWSVGGSVVTALTFGVSASGSTGDYYLVGLGAILFGIIDFFRGFLGWLKYGSMDFVKELRLRLKCWR